jgi:UDP-2,3-diacylglucosamine pyrophosphatase LpxH
MLGVRIAQRMSSTESKPLEQQQLAGRAAFLETWARARLQADAGLGYVVCGHSHVAALVEVGSNRYYLNAGDWLKSFSYIRVEDGEPVLCTWVPSPRAGSIPAREPQG